MTLWKKAHLNENILEIVRKISLIIGILVLIFLVELYAKHYGYDQAGLVKQAYYQAQADDLKIKQIQFSGGVGLRTYEYAAAVYSSAVFFVVFFLIGKLLEARSIYKILQTRIISQFLCLASLATIIYKLQFFLNWKSTRLSDEFFMSGDYDGLLRDSVTLDWFCFGTIIFLLLLQIGILLFYHFNKTKDKEIKR